MEATEVQDRKAAEGSDTLRIRIKVDCVRLVREKQPRKDVRKESGFPGPELTRRSPGTQG